MDINEKTTLVVTAGFFDEDGVAATPTAGTYRIDDRDSGTAILASTALPSLGTTVDITVTAAQNALLNQNSDRETRELTVEWTYSAGTKSAKSVYTFNVLNLRFVS